MNKAAVYLGIALSPFLVARALSSGTLESKIANSEGHTIHVQVDDADTQLGVPGALVEAVNTAYPDHDYSATTDGSGGADLEEVYTLVRADKTLVPDNYELQQNFPNPFNPSTTLRFGLSRYTDVDVSIYNIRGELVKTLVDRAAPAGLYQVGWDGTNDSGRPVASGQYIAQMTTIDGYRNSVKMLLVDGGARGDAHGFERIGSFKKSVAKAMAADDFDFRVTHPDYEPLENTIPISGDTTLYFQLTPKELEKMTMGWVTDIANDSLLSGQPVKINGQTVESDSTGQFTFTDLPPGDYRITVGDDDSYQSMERTITVGDADTTFTIPMRLVKNDSGLVEFLNGTVFAKNLTPGGWTMKWEGPASNYVNTDNVEESNQGHIEHFLSDPDLGESTYGVHDYTAGDIQKVSEEDRPAYGTSGTVIWDRISATPSYAIYEDPENRGIIDAAVVSMPNGTNIETVYSEGLSAFTGIDEILHELNDKYETVRNDPSNLDQFSDYDIIINKFNQDRDPNTTDGDVGPSNGLGKASAYDSSVFVVDGQVVGEKDLTYEQVNVLHKLIDDSGRTPTYVVFGQN